MPDSTPPQAAPAVVHERKGSFSDAELDALFQAMTTAADNEQRVYEQLCDAEDEYQQSGDEMDGSLMRMCAERWRAAGSHAANCRRDYMKAMHPEHWEVIRAAIAEKKKKTRLCCEGSNLKLWIKIQLPHC